MGLGNGFLWHGEREARCCSWGEGDADMGRRWRAWWCLGEQQRQERGPGELWRRLGERERCEWGRGASEVPWHCGELESRGRKCLVGGKR